MYFSLETARKGKGSEMVSVDGAQGKGCWQSKITQLGPVCWNFRPNRIHTSFCDLWPQRFNLLNGPCSCVQITLNMTGKTFHQTKADTEFNTVQLYSPCQWCGKRTHRFPRSSALILKRLPRELSKIQSMKGSSIILKIYVSWSDFFSSLMLNTASCGCSLFVLISFKCDHLQQLSHGRTSFPFIFLKYRPTKDVISEQNLKLRSHRGNQFRSLGSLLCCSFANEEIWPSSTIINQTRQNLHVCIIWDICIKTKMCLGTVPLSRREVSQNFDSLYNYKVKRRLLMERLDGFLICNLMSREKCSGRPSYG